MIYDDGLDDDGYPIPVTPWRLPYRRGSEEDSAGWEPQTITAAAISAVDRIGYAVEVNKVCDSPIEVILGTAVMAFFKSARLSVDLVPQFAWSYYRSDWAIVTPNGTLLIECDGRDFHSSPDQVQHDATKDSAALERGYRTVRFTGAEITRDADHCARTVFDAVCRL